MGRSPQKSKVMASLADTPSSNQVHTLAQSGLSDSSSVVQPLFIPLLIQQMLSQKSLVPPVIIGKRKDLSLRMTKQDV